jgi:hypothetical protein
MSTGWQQSLQNLWAGIAVGFHRERRERRLLGRVGRSGRERRAGPEKPRLQHYIAGQTELAEARNIIDSLGTKNGLNAVQPEEGGVQDQRSVA